MCSCDDGYLLQADRRTCEGINIPLAVNAFGYPVMPGPIVSACIYLNEGS